MVDDGEIEYEEDDEIKVINNESKMMKAKVVKIIKSRFKPAISKNMKVN